jgi:predicted flap endonuclease-1-like 5' DNA nuclease
MKREVLEMKQLRLALIAMLAFGALSGCGLPSGSPLAVTEDADAEANRAYSIIDMQGIGPVYAAKLKEAGLSTTARFLDATKSRKERLVLAEKTGISYKLILRWTRKADLMRIPGIGVKQADLLEASGVASVKELAQRNAKNLTERVWAANNVAQPFVKGGTPTETRITAWIAAAKTIVQQVDDEQP